MIFDHWNRGLATEMAGASLRIGFEQLALPEIASWTLPFNIASQRVMEENRLSLRHRYCLRWVAASTLSSYCDRLADGTRLTDCLTANQALHSTNCLTGLKVMSLHRDCGRIPPCCRCISGSRKASLTRGEWMDFFRHMGLLENEFLPRRWEVLPAAGLKRAYNGAD